MISNYGLLITGASGFIGSNLLKIAEAEQLDVIGLSRSTQDTKMQKIKSYLDIDSYVQSNQICVHLAGDNNTNSMDDNEINTLKYLANHYGSRLIYISSSYVYGYRYTNPINEKDDTDIINDYSNRKIDCEKIVLNNSGLILRLSNVYGPGMVNNICNHIYREFVNNSGLINVNNALNIRDFIHVNDICHAIILCIKNLKSGVYNLSTGTGTTVAELCYLFAKHLKISEDSYKVISETNDDTSIVLDPKKFCNEFSWKPRVSLSEGVLDWINKYHNIDIKC